MHALQFVTSNNIMLIYIRVSLHDLLFILKAQLFLLFFSSHSVFVSIKRWNRNNIGA